PRVTIDTLGRAQERPRVGTPSGTRLATSTRRASTREGTRCRRAARGERAHPPEVAPPRRRATLREARPCSAVRRPRSRSLHRIIAPDVYLRAAAQCRPPRLKKCVGPVGTHRPRPISCGLWPATAV